ncbi:MAG: hypothetical protein OEQ18_02165, partial [Gammaproteobacteria bacterium]|nr:hypothetical protein [Gammaproteobacteria bacterium]
ATVAATPVDVTLLGNRVISIDPATVAATPVDVATLHHAALSTAGLITGLIFPSNPDVTDGETVRFKFTDPHLNGLPIYGASGAGVTYIWRYKPAQQTGYYTTFFWANDDGVGLISTFIWDGGGAGTYYGAHPYPQGGAGGTVHDWEISVEANDFVNGLVVKDTWYTQAFRAWGDINANKDHEFYWDLPNVDAGHKVTRQSPTSWANTNPPSPALTFGDAPWMPGKEMLSGILRGLQIYSVLLSEADILLEAANPLSTVAGAAGIWYLNLNPTPTDISDKSGQGHHPAWVQQNAELILPTLYSAGTAITAVAVTTAAVSFAKNYALNIIPASVAVSMVDTTLRTHAGLTLDPATIQLTTIDPAVVRHVMLAVDAASISLTPTDLLFLRHAVLTVDVAAYTITPVDITFQYSATPTAYALTVDPASVTLSPVDVALAKASILAIDPATADLTTADLAFARGFQVSVDPASITLNAVDVTLAYQPLAGAYELNVEPASVSVSPANPSMIKRSVLTVDPAAVDMQLTSLTLTRGYRLSVDPATTTATMTDVTLRGAFLIPCDPAQVGVTPIPLFMTWSGAPVYGNVLLRTNERLRVPGLTNERLRVPGILNETLTEG